MPARCRENGFWPSPSRSEASRSRATGLGSTGQVQRENQLWLPVVRTCSHCNGYRSLGSYLAEAKHSTASGFDQFDVGLGLTLVDHQRHEIAPLCILGV